MYEGERGMKENKVCGNDEEGMMKKERRRRNDDRYVGWRDRHEER